MFFLWIGLWDLFQKDLQHGYLDRRLPNRKCERQISGSLSSPGAELYLGGIVQELRVFHLTGHAGKVYPIERINKQMDVKPVGHRIPCQQRIRRRD